MLLRSVVDVAFEPAAFGVVRSHDPVRDARSSSARTDSSSIRSWSSLVRLTLRTTTPAWDTRSCRSLSSGRESGSRGACGRISPRTFPDG